MYTLYHGDCRVELKKLASNSVDSIVCDPPYELWSGKKSGKGFMGKTWDGTGIAYDVSVWEEALRVLKPGGYLLSFGGTRTYHRMACAIEDAGFIIKDQLQWIYSQGFPKSLDISKALDKAVGAERAVVGTQKLTGSARQSTTHKGHGGKATTASDPRQYVETHIPLTAPTSDLAIQWDGYGTALAPANEPICLAQKPLEGTYIQNITKWGVGALNIGASRIPGEPTPINKLEQWSGFGEQKNPAYTQEINTKGRWPKNVILDEEAGALLDAQSGYSKSVQSKRKQAGKTVGNSITLNKYRMNEDNYGGYTDSGGASRFYYCAKTSVQERNIGLANLPTHTPAEMTGRKEGSAGLVMAGGKPNPFAGTTGQQPRSNNHPTVKPLALMKYLVNLITPAGGTVLDPFAGSGTTGVAAIQTGHNAILVEMTDEYIPIIEQRMAHAEQEVAEVLSNPLQTTLSETTVKEVLL